LLELAHQVVGGVVVEGIVGLADRDAQFADLVAFLGVWNASSTISLMILAAGRCCERLMAFSYSALDARRLRILRCCGESDIEISLLQ
jgi:hypothetical protein